MDGVIHTTFHLPIIYSHSQLKRELVVVNDTPTWKLVHVTRTDAPRYDRSFEPTTTRLDPLNTFTSQLTHYTLPA